MVRVIILKRTPNRLGEHGTIGTIDKDGKPIAVEPVRRSFEEP